MDPMWDEFAADDKVHAMREEVFHGRLAEWLKAAQHKKVHARWWDGTQHQAVPMGAAPRSALLFVGQFWADNADDEVHLSMSASSRLAPAWPHACSEGVKEGTVDFDICSSCSDAIGYEIGSGYGELIPAFEAFCHEGASQEDDYAAAYRPLALARLEGDGSIGVHVVGRIVRPWLDMPRSKAPEALPLDGQLRALAERAGEDPSALAVLHDALLERALPETDRRAELLSFSLMRGDREDERTLLATHGRQWLGALHAHVPRAGVRYERGIPVEIGLYVDPDADVEIDEDDALPWVFGPRVRFLPNSARPIWPMLARARSLGPLDAEAVRALARLGALRATELELEDEAALEALLSSASAFPRLEVLKLAGQRFAPRSSPWPKTLARLEVACAMGPDEHVAAARAWREAKLPFLVAVQMFDEDARVATGWSVALEGDRVAIGSAGYWAAATREHLAELERAFERASLMDGLVWSPG